MSSISLCRVGHDESHCAPTGRVAAAAAAAAAATAQILECAGRRGADCVWDVQRDSPLHLPNVSSSLSPCLSILSCVRKIPLSTRGQWCPLTGPPNCAPEAPVTDGLSDAGSYALCPELCPELPGPNSIRTRALRLARYRSPHRTWSRRRSDCALRSPGSAKAEKEESTQTTGRPGARHTLAPLPHTHILLRAHSSTPLSMYIIYHITSGLSVQCLDIFPFPSFSFFFCFLMGLRRIGAYYLHFLMQFVVSLSFL